MGGVFAFYACHSESKQKRQKFSLSELWLEQEFPHGTTPYHWDEI
jgi:hypothetical protein